ncbi:hypothetical protein [Streptomyces sediminimaris]|uniref:hypothetical protein n=1 Tax=Streptomyces sediminimaris TaxID=3383721 RepID=UPI00399BD1C7
MTKQSPPGRGDGTPPADASENSARRKVADFSIPELEQVLKAVLERISDDPVLQQAYEAGKLPVVEDLLRRTEPPRRDQASQSAPAPGMSQQGPVNEPARDPQWRSRDADAVTLFDPREQDMSTQAGRGTQPQDGPDPGEEAADSRLDAPFPTPAVPDSAQHSPTVQQSATVGDFAAATAHPASRPDGPSATVNFAESTAHPATPAPGADVGSPPSNPVSDTRALTFHATNVNITYVGAGSVNVTQQGPRSASVSATSATTPAAAPQTTSASSANRPRRR